MKTERQTVNFAITDTVIQVLQNMDKSHLNHHSITDLKDFLEAARISKGPNQNHSIEIRFFEIS